MNLVTIESQIVLGYFSFDCQSDGWCVFGCGKRPDTLCANCAHETGEDKLPNWHPLNTPEPSEFEGEIEAFDICDRCEELI